MSDLRLLQVMTVLHLVGAATFVGSNILLERLVKRLETIPPRQAARLSDRLGVDLAWINFTALAVLGASGVTRLFITGEFREMGEVSFYVSSHGAPLAIMMGAWLTLVASSVLLTYVLRPRVIVKLPFDASREDVELRAGATMTAAAWMRRLGRYNLVAGLIAVTVGALQLTGGFR